MTSRLPWPLDKGDKLRAFHQIRQLSQHHDVYLFSLAEPKGSHDSTDLTALQAITKGILVQQLSWWRRCLRLALAPFSSRPFQVHWFYQKSAQIELDGWIKKLEPDIILCQLVRMASYVQHTHRVPRVLDYMDALSAGMARQSRLAHPAMRWIYRIEYQRLKAFEAQVFDYFDGKTIISAADRKLIAHPERHLIRVVPNGIDTEFFQLDHDRLPENPPRILFTGNMSYPPNVDAAKQLVLSVLPLLKTPHVRVTIAGTNPAPEIQALQSDRVEVTGWLPDIRDAYEVADAFVAPLRIGTGQQNKILEAMSMELPCITTQHVASGFPSAGAEAAPLRIANSAEGIAREVDALLGSPEARRSLGSLSRSWVEKHCNWSTSTELLTGTFVHSMSNESESIAWPIQKPTS